MAKISPQLEAHFPMDDNECSWEKKLGHDHERNKLHHLGFARVDKRIPKASATEYYHIAIITFKILPHNFYI